MNLVTITSVGQLKDYKDDWSFILEDIDNTNPFIEFEWLYEWWSYLGQGKNVEIIAVQQHGRFVAFFPFIYKKKWFGYEYNFMALGQANYMDFIAYQHVLDNAIEFVFDYLFDTKKRVLFNLHGLLESNQTPNSLNAYFRKREIENRTYRIVTPFVDLENMNLDDYMKERKTLHGLDRRQKRLRSLGTVKLATSRPEEMDTIFQLHSKRWEKKNDTSGFTSQEKRHFFRKLAENTTGAMRVQIESLYLEDRLIAFTYGFKCRGRYMGYVLGHDDSFDYFSPGRILVKEKIKKSVNSPIKKLDMSIGYEPYKFEWSTGLDHTTRMVFSSNSIQVKWRRNLIWGKEWLLSGIKKSREAVLFRRNTVGKIKYILRNLRSIDTVSKVKPDIVSAINYVTKFFFERQKHVILKMDLQSNSDLVTHETFKPVTIKKVFANHDIEDGDMKEIGNRLYRGFTGYSTKERLSVDDICWINQNVIRIDAISYLTQLRKGTVYIDKWNHDNIMDICAFIKKDYKAKIIVIELEDPDEKTVASLKSRGFFVEKEIHNQTFFGFKKSTIIDGCTGT
ncbi:GNAT family N-acetyltransferase [Sporosarcina sp. YIM B06819]|uniref:GNAT family N-acetyltransferase n=1 Tax=Sporosarcina sp. YIM B06819 TaxID=3081769 RepID=UPI00298D02EB|nr:GNAT family N-acetyltransferase [Sporosarcina sp. YIM B06819]